MERTDWNEAIAGFIFGVVFALAAVALGTMK